MSEPAPAGAGVPLIDSHQHLILRGALGYGWTAGIPALAAGDFTRADYEALVAGRGVAGTIFMETGVDDADYRAEARLVAGMLGAGRLGAGRLGAGGGAVPMLGQIAGCRPEDAGLEDWIAECRGLGVVGFRRILHVMPDELSRSPGFRANLRRIGAAGFPFDLCVLARQHALAEDLVRACPDVTFVLDHCGVPDIAGGGFAPWAAGLARLAALPNLWVKLSGITAYCPPGGATDAAVRPWVDRVLQLFGPARMVWGGDWPVVNLGAGLPGWIDMTRGLLAGLSVDEQAAIASGNARRLWRLPA